MGSSQRHLRRRIPEITSGKFPAVDVTCDGHGHDSTVTFIRRGYVSYLKILRCRRLIHFNLVLKLGGFVSLVIYFRWNITTVSNAADTQ
jgi:hypothetical protein